MDSVLRPRDIQARIRSGESPEAVAAAAQTSVDKIMGFATPVLAERAYVAEQALKASVRRRAGDGPIGHLGEAVAQRLATRGVDAEQLSWDAWRREDGRWTLVVDQPHGGPRAQFVYDAAGRYVMAEDDEARWLVGERGATPSPAVAPAVEEPEDTAQLPLGDDAIGVVTGLRSVTTRASDSEADDWMQTQASERSAPRPPVPDDSEVAAPTLFDAPETSPDDEPVVEPVQTQTTGAAEPAEPTGATDPAEPAEVADEPKAAPPAKPRKSSKSKRASVPSWDEIMFGKGD